MGGEGDGMDNDWHSYSKSYVLVVLIAGSDSRLHLYANSVVERATVIEVLLVE